MKKLIVICLIAVLSMASQSFTSSSYRSPKLYPAIDSFFKSVKSASISAKHKSALDNLTNYCVDGRLADNEHDIVYLCSDDSFRSLAAQIFTQSLLGVYKYKRVKAFSCGMEKGSVSNDLIKLLTDAGYKVTTKDGGNIEIKYSDDLPPILITPTKFDDVSLPKHDFLSLSLCSSDENCQPLTGAAYKYSLDYNNQKTTDASIVFKQIAGEMYYAVNNAHERVP